MADKEAREAGRLAANPLASGSALRLAELAGAFSFAGDLGCGQPMGHSLRTCRIGLRIAEVLKLSVDDQADIFYSALLVHAGCTAGAPQFAAMLAGDELAALRDMYLCEPGSILQGMRWISRHVAPDSRLPERTLRVVHAFLQADRAMADFDKGCSDVGAKVAARMGLPDRTQMALYHICEMWNGRGPHRLRGASIPLATRVVSASMVLEVFLSSEGPEGAEAAARRYGARYFDPDVASAFLSVAGGNHRWDDLRDDQWDQVMGMEPGPSRRHTDEAGLDEALTAFADFADFKSANAAGRSRDSSRLAAQIADRLGLTPDEIKLVRRAALVQDVGLVAVPSFLLAKSPPLAEIEQEQLRLHPYYTQMVLSRVPALQQVAAVAGMRHERLDGSGYHRGLPATAVPVHARIIAIASAFTDLVRGGPGVRALSAEEAFEALRRPRGAYFDAACFDALSGVLQAGRTRVPRPQTWPKDLTQREVEVLRLVSQGLSRRAVAQRLVVSEHTVRHHLENVYSKIGVSSRAGAVLFAIENGLLG